MDACDSRLTAKKEVVALASGDTVDEMETREGGSVTYHHQCHQHDQDTRHPLEQDYGKIEENSH